jgi:hypothetical protein
MVKVEVNLHAISTSPVDSVHYLEVAAKRPTCPSPWPVTYKGHHLQSEVTLHGVTTHNTETWICIAEETSIIAIQKHKKFNDRVFCFHWIRELKSKLLTLTVTEHFWFSLSDVICFSPFLSYCNAGSGVHEAASLDADVNYHSVMTAFS